MNDDVVVEPVAAGDFDRVRRTELLISNILRTGVLASVALVLLGTAVTFARHPGYLNSSSDLEQLRNAGIRFPATLGEVLRGISAFDGPAFVMAGLLLLIATPILRVAVSVVAFIQLGDRTFTLITTGVFTLLLIALFLGQAGG